MTNLPEPLTPADCDLQDFKFMPLDVARLRDSDMASEQSPEENWAAVLLWAAAWHQVPAASIPDSENWIAKAAGYMMRGSIDKRWKDVRAGAMRGFVLCSDGRWYHSVVAEKANESWIGKLKQRLKTECARIKKHNDRHGTRIHFPDFDGWLDQGCPTGQALPVPRDTPPLSLDDTHPVPTKTPSKGQGEGQGEGQLTSKAKADDDTTDVACAPTVPDVEPDLPPAGDGFDAPRSAPLPTREVPTIGQTPEIQLMVALRRMGVNVMSTNPHLLQWVADGITLAQLTEAVLVARESKGETASIAPAYLVPIVEKIRNPPAAAAAPGERKAPDWEWKRSDQGITNKGRELGMFARGGESYRDFANRIQTEIDKRKGQP